MTNVANVIERHGLHQYRSIIPGLNEDALFSKFVEAFSARVGRTSSLGSVENYYEAIAAAQLEEASTCALPEPQLDPAIIDAYAARLQIYREQLDYLGSDEAYQRWVTRVATLEQLSFVLAAAGAVGIDTRELSVWQRPRDSAETLEPDQIKLRSSRECLARLVELRVDYTVAQMRAKNPTITAFLRDVPYREQIVLNVDSEVQATAAPVRNRDHVYMKLSDILGHSNLFIAYPELASITVWLIKADCLQDGQLVAYCRYEDGSEAIEMAIGAPEKQLRGALMREVQRVINRIEGL